MENVTIVYKNGIGIATTAPVNYDVQQEDGEALILLSKEETE